MTLGEWLNRVILDDNDPAAAQWDDALEAFPGFDGDVANDDDRLLRAMINRLSDRIEKTEQASSSTLSELDKAITQLATNVAKVAKDAKAAKVANVANVTKSWNLRLSSVPTLLSLKDRSSLCYDCKCNKQTSKYK